MYVFWLYAKICITLLKKNEIPPPQKNSLPRKYIASIRDIVSCQVIYSHIIHIFQWPSNMLKKAGKVIFHYDNITKEGRGAGNDQLLQRQKKNGVRAKTKEVDN